VKKLFGAAALFAIAGQAIVDLNAQTTEETVDLSSAVLRANAALPQHNPPGEKLKDVLDRMAARPPLISTHAIESITSDDAVGGTPEQMTALYRKRTCAADAIVTGHPIKWQYHLSSSGTAIYGDYDFAVESVLKDTATAPHLKNHIVLTRPGGTMTLGTGAISDVKDTRQAYLPLEPDGSYLILLQYIPASGAYQGVDAFATFVQTSGAWRMARRAYSAYALPLFELGTFELTIRQWLTRAFDSGGSGGFLNRLPLGLWPESRIPAAKRILPLFIEHPRADL